MASDDDEVAGPSINEDLRMAGLQGDDESDLEAGREELFGSFAVPIEVVDGAAGAAAAGAGDGAAGAAAPTTGKRKRKMTSDAWNDFEKIFTMVNGRMVRTGAKCCW
ncbi:unnamed protein product [Urochloa humidicola]